jgi:nucleotide-binding universal stress UspA family protein
MFETVVVGVDGSATAAEAARQATELVKMTGGTLHLVTAYSSGTLTAGTGDAAKAIGTGEVARSVLDDLESRAKIAGVAVVTHGKSGAPADVICQVAEDEHADLIVVGNKGMQGARRVLGSVPNSVAHNAPCSILIIATT